MRQTRFRGKHERSGQWYEGDFITDTREFNRTCDRAYILPHWDKLNCPIPVIKETVGEFTGLRDKNGKEIYEGDIVKRSNDTPFSMVDGSLRYDTWKVEFKYSRWSFINTPGSPSSSWPSFSSNAEYMEVIGNIHDNPELLIDAI